MTGQSWNDLRAAELLELQITAISLGFTEPMHVTVQGQNRTVRIRFRRTGMTQIDVNNQCVVSLFDGGATSVTDPGEKAFIEAVAAFFQQLVHGTYLVSWSPLGLSKLGSETRVTVENMEQGLLKLLG